MATPLTTDQQTEVLFKKALGAATANPGGSATIEPAALPRVMVDQLWAQTVPTPAPALNAQDGTYTGSGYRYTYSGYTYLARYTGVSLSSLLLGLKPGFSFKVAGATNLLENSIPFNYDTSNPGYTVNVYVGGNKTPMSDLTNPWILDGAAGILSFFPPSGTGIASAVTIDFSRYEGTIGLSGAISATSLTASGDLSAAKVTASGLVRADAGLSTTTLTATGLVRADAGLSTTTLTATSIASGLLQSQSNFPYTTTSASSSVIGTATSKLLLRTNLYTIECFFKPSAAAATGNSPILSIGTNGNGNEIRIGQTVGGGSNFGALVPKGTGDTGTLDKTIVASSPLSSGTWYHIALVRSAAALTTLYVNGVSVGTYAYNYDFNPTASPKIYLYTNPYSADGSVQGSIESVRIVSGQALYTGAFTPPVRAPLDVNTVGASGTNIASAITGTVVFLAAVSGDIADVSTNPISLTATAVSPSATAYALSVLGPASVSGGLDTTSISATNLSAGTGNFTDALTTSGVVSIRSTVAYNQVQTAQPADYAQLVVGGTTFGNSRLYLANSYTSGGGTASLLQSSDYYSGVDHGTNLLINPLGGNVGIGTTPAYKLDVAGTGNFTGALTTNGIAATSTVSITSPVTYAQLSQQPATYAQLTLKNTVGTSRLYLANGETTNAGAASMIQAGSYNGTTEGTTNLMINPLGGNVGIGTTSPAYKLDVAGTGNFTGALTTKGIAATSAVSITSPVTDNQIKTAQPADYAQLSLKPTTGSSRLYLANGYSAGVGAPSLIQSSDYFSSEDHGTNLLINPLGGYVGIGTTDPGYTLDVAGTGHIRGALITSGYLGIGIAPSWPLHVLTSQQGSGGGGWIYGGGHTAMQGDTRAGSVSIYTPNYILALGMIFTSDQRMKQNISSFNTTKALEMIRTLEPVSYNWIDPSKGTRDVVGFIAQQVEKHIPNAVHTISDDVPNVFSICNISSANYTTSSQTLCLSLIDPQNAGLSSIQQSTILSMFLNDDTQIFGSVSAIENSTLTLSLDKPIPESARSTQIFVYGEQVNDLHAIRHDQLFALNVAATQALDCIVQNQSTLIGDLQTAVAQQSAQISTLLARL